MTQPITPHPFHDLILSPGDPSFPHCSPALALGDFPQDPTNPRSLAPIQGGVKVQHMLSPGVGRQGLGLSQKLEILDKAPPPCWNLQERWWKVSKGAPQCWGSACLACPASLGLLATTQQLPPALASSCSLASSPQEDTFHFTC